MNKIFNSMMALAIAAFTFTACEDVPEPYNNPYDAFQPVEPVVVDPAGKGTIEEPWNVTALQNACENLAGGAFLNDGAEVYVKGIVVETTEVSAQYGNATYYIADDKNGVVRFLVYRGKLVDGASVTASTDLEVGDTVVVCGKVKNYVDKNNNSTLEFDQGNYLVSLVKASGETPSKPSSDGHGTAEAPLTVAQAMALIDAESTVDEAYVKGIISKIDSYSSQYKSITYWISDDGGTTTQLQVYSGKGLDGADFNAKEDLTVGQTVTVKGKLKKYNDIYEFDKSSSIVSIGDDSSTSKYGTAEAPLTVAQAIALIDAESTVDEAYVKGIISQIDSYNSTYKSITYWISDDGGTTTQLQVYSGKGLDGADFAAKEDLTVGQTVTIKGKLKKYNTTYEFDKTSSIVSIGDGATSKYGTAEAPLTVAQAIALIDAESTVDEAYVKGIISQIDSYNSTYKSITYWISDDGGTTTQLQVYSGKGLDGADFAAKEDLTVGKTVTIKGKLKKYNTTYEFDKTSSIVSIGDGATSKYGTAEAPLTVAQAIALIDAESTVDEAYVKGIISKIDSYNSTYKSITYWISDDGGTTTQLQVYSGKGLDGADFAAKEDLTVGKTVTIKGKLKKYNTTYEFDKTSSIVSIK